MDNKQAAAEARSKRQAQSRLELPTHEDLVHARDDKVGRVTFPHAPEVEHARRAVRGRVDENRRIRVRALDLRAKAQTEPRTGGVALCGV